jgi:hypothetical protein
MNNGKCKEDECLEQQKNINETAVRGSWRRIGSRGGSNEDYCLF